MFQAYIQHYFNTDVRAILLTDVLILMERNEDKDKLKYHLRCHTNLDAVKEKAEVRRIEASLCTLLMLHHVTRCVQLFVLLRPL